MHRDVKPHNIVLYAPELQESDKLEENEVVDLSNVEYKIADFNLACYSPGGLERISCGTPLYASPELLDRKTYSFGNDIW